MRYLEEDHGNDLAILHRGNSQAAEDACLRVYASDRFRAEREHLESFWDFCLKAAVRIWSWLFYMCPFRFTSVGVISPCSIGGISMPANTPGTGCIVLGSGSRDDGLGVRVLS